VLIEELEVIDDVALVHGPHPTGAPAVRASVAGMADDFEDVRSIALTLPETNEWLSHGMPTFFIRDKKVFVSCVRNHHDDGIFGIWVAAAPGVQDELVTQEPDRFYVPPYVGHRGWVGLRLDRDVDLGEVQEVITDSYRLVAPKTLVKQLEAS
jgi:hypothetical protein